MGLQHVVVEDNLRKIVQLRTTLICTVGLRHDQRVEVGSLGECFGTALIHYGGLATSRGGLGSAIVRVVLELP